MIILVLGGFYFWGEKLDTNGDEAVIGDEATSEVADLEADLADVDAAAADLEADLNAVEDELAQ